MRNLLIISFCALLIGAGGCNKDNGNETATTFNCFFLTVGNEWTYDHTVLGAHSVLKVKIESEKDSVFRVSRSLNFAVPTYQYWYTDGPYLKAYLEGETRSDSRIIFQCNANVGNSWEAASFDVSGETDFYQVTSVNRSINTFAGDFTASKLKVDLRHTAEEQYQYWSDTYGLVFQEGNVALELTAKNH